MGGEEVGHRKPIPLFGHQKHFSHKAPHRPRQLNQGLKGRGQGERSGGVGCRWPGLRNFASPRPYPYPPRPLAPQNPVGRPFNALTTHLPCFPPHTLCTGLGSPRPPAALTSLRRTQDLNSRAAPHVVLPPRRSHGPAASPRGRYGPAPRSTRLPRHRRRRVSCRLAREPLLVRCP